MSGHDFSEGGKRTGSMGDLIIRRKIKVKMTDPSTKKNYFYVLYLKEPDIFYFFYFFVFSHGAVFRRTLIAMGIL